MDFELIIFRALFFTVNYQTHLVSKDIFPI